jgi:hypothetical protein
VKKKGVAMKCVGFGMNCAVLAGGVRKGRNSELVRHSTVTETSAVEACR